MNLFRLSNYFGIGTATKIIFSACRHDWDSDRYLGHDLWRSPIGFA
jgi:hypothetical protein